MAARTARNTSVTPQINRSWFAMAVILFYRQFVDQEVVLILVRGPIVSKGAWVSDPELNSCKEITYMGIGTGGAGNQDLGTRPLDNQSFTRRNSFTRCELVDYFGLALMGRRRTANSPPYKSGNKRSSSLFRFPEDLILYHLVFLCTLYPQFTSTINLFCVTVAMATINTVVNLRNAYS
jgi:hypothetical protein